MHMINLYNKYDQTYNKYDQTYNKYDQTYNKYDQTYNKYDQTYNKYVCPGLATSTCQNDLSRNLYIFYLLI